MLAVDALEFLSLGYKPNPKLGVVFTPDVMERYKSIHRFLLKLVRVDESVNSIFTWRKTYKSTKHLATIDELYKKAKRFVNGLFRYAMNIAVGDVWIGFMRNVEECRNVEGLVIAHGNCVERIRWRLFLKGNQRKMAGFLDEIMQIVLTFCRGVENGDCKDVLGLLKEFDERVGVVCSVLRSKSLMVEQDYFGREEKKGKGEKAKRISNWGARAEERVCFNVLLAELE